MIDSEIMGEVTNSFCSETPPCPVQTSPPHNHPPKGSSRRVVAVSSHLLAARTANHQLCPMLPSVHSVDPALQVKSGISSLPTCSSSFSSFLSPGAPTASCSPTASSSPMGHPRSVSSWFSSSSSSSESSSSSWPPLLSLPSPSIPSSSCTSSSLATTASIIASLLNSCIQTTSPCQNKPSSPPLKAVGRCSQPTLLSDHHSPPQSSTLSSPISQHHLAHHPATSALSSPISQHHLHPPLYGPTGVVHLPDASLPSTPSSLSSSPFPPSSSYNSWPTVEEATSHHYNQQFTSALPPLPAAASSHHRYTPSKLTRPSSSRHASQQRSPPPTTTANNNYNPYCSTQYAYPKCNCFVQLPPQFLSTFLPPHLSPTLSPADAAAALHCSVPSLITLYHVWLLHKVVSVLYMEQIPPSFEEVRRRLEKQQPCSFLSSSFLLVCRAHSLPPSLSSPPLPTFPPSVTLPFPARPFQVAQTPQADLHVYLHSPPAAFRGFIDPNSSSFSYPQHYLPLLFLHLLDRYRLDPRGEAYKGGRFLLAEILRSSGPYCLRSLTQGQLCHLLQKSLDYGILSYESNSIRSAVACTALSKAYAARNSAVCKQQDKVKRERKLQLIRSRLARFLHSNPLGLAMCRLPIMYKHEYDVSLNIETLGYTKLADFLQKEASDLCVIRPSARHRCIVLPIQQEQMSPDGLLHPSTFTASSSPCSSPITPASPTTTSVESAHPLSGQLSRPAQLALLLHSLRTHRWCRLISFASWHYHHTTTAPPVVVVAEATPCCPSSPPPPNPSLPSSAGCPPSSSPSSPSTSPFLFLSPIPCSTPSLSPQLPPPLLPSSPPSHPSSPPVESADVDAEVMRLLHPCRDLHRRCLADMQAIWDRPYKQPTLHQQQTLHQPPTLHQQPTLQQQTCESFYATAAAFTATTDALIHPPAPHSQPMMNSFLPSIDVSAFACATSRLVEELQQAATPPTSSFLTPPSVSRRPPRISHRGYNKHNTPPPPWRTIPPPQTVPPPPTKAEEVISGQRRLPLDVSCIPSECDGFAGYVAADLQHLPSSFSASPSLSPTTTASDSCWDSDATSAEFDLMVEGVVAVCIDQEEEEPSWWQSTTVDTTLDCGATTGSRLQHCGGATTGSRLQHCGGGATTVSSLEHWDEREHLTADVATSRSIMDSFDPSLLTTMRPPGFSPLRATISSTLSASSSCFFPPSSSSNRTVMAGGGGGGSCSLSSVRGSLLSTQPHMVAGCQSTLHGVDRDESCSTAAAAAASVTCWQKMDRSSASSFSSGGGKKAAGGPMLPPLLPSLLPPDNGPSTPFVLFSSLAGESRNNSGWLLEELRQLHGGVASIAR
eukprot:GHVS01095556.1.p1 GENE.GHVS01095556.1~~GHVS01095556.1.p1  ORF type:complete len:1338 (-),score=430.47 GHVS01095556.1:677-4690(-)